MFRRKKDKDDATKALASTGRDPHLTLTASASEGNHDFEQTGERFEPAAPSQTGSGPAEGSSMQPTKPSSGFVPEIPRRTLDLPGAPARRAATPRSAEAKKLTVGPEISLTGEITACDMLVVEGNVHATLENSRHLEVAETGFFKGKVVIDEAVIAGEFDGTLIVRKTLSVRNKGHVRGTVRFGRLEVELGGEIEGDVALFKDSDESKQGAAE